MSKNSSLPALPLPPTAVLIDMLYYQVNREIAARLQAAGFDEIRAAHGKVFENLGEGCTVSELADRAQVTKQSMAELVAHLEKHKYLVRAPSPTDRRAKTVQLTARGKQAVRAAQTILDEIHSEWLAALGQKRFTQLTNDLNEMLQIIA